MKWYCDYCGSWVYMSEKICWLCEKFRAFDAIDVVKALRLPWPGVKK